MSYVTIQVSTDDLVEDLSDGQAFTDLLIAIFDRYEDRLHWWADDVALNECEASRAAIEALATAFGFAKDAP